MNDIVNDLSAVNQIPSGIIKPLDYQLTSDYLAGGRSGVVGGGGGGGGALLDYEPSWPSYETSLLHDSLLAQRLADRKARLIPGVPANYQAAEYASRYGPATTTRHAGRRADFVAPAIDINCRLPTCLSQSIVLLLLLLIKSDKCSLLNTKFITSSMKP